ncbi:MAG: hypothetical protein M3136_13270 [Thermoproteota archaeon]|nr:hypothetical protein [Thermoproteota archaeon]
MSKDHFAVDIIDVNDNNNDNNIELQEKKLNLELLLFPKRKSRNSSQGEI